MKVKVKLFMVYEAHTMKSSEALFSKLKEMTEPLVFNLSVDEIGEYKAAKLKSDKVRKRE